MTADFRLTDYGQPSPVQDYSLFSLPQVYKHMHATLSSWPLIAAAYGFPESGTTLQPFGPGLIHRTWLLEEGVNRYILQQINDRVFTSPERIDGNIRQLSHWLRQHAPLYYFVHPRSTRQGHTLLHLLEGWFRVYPFVPGSHSITVAHNPDIAFEAARQFGGFTRVLADFPVQRLQPVLPGFHDLYLRFKQFTEALRNGMPQRLKDAASLSSFLLDQEQLVRRYTTILSSKDFTRRVTHHDTKISNVLLDETGKGLCVIDLDTVMPGYFISDAGDMIRTCCAGVDEESTDWEAIEIRPAFFQAVAEGYLGEMAPLLSREERAHFVYAGQFMTYMQALRFITDYLTGDRYYGARYPLHNFNRARNQVTLLKMITRDAKRLQDLT